VVALCRMIVLQKTPTNGKAIGFYLTFHNSGHVSDCVRVYLVSVHQLDVLAQSYRVCAGEGTTIKRTLETLLCNQK